MSCQPTRRGFLQTAGIIAGSLFLPRLLFAAKKPDFFFIHADTGSSWPVADPVLWCLENARQPILERAKERLLTLTPADSTRIIRLVTRRCRLNLLELQRRRVVVHYWGPQGLADLRPFFKAHCLARKDIEVVVRERKREIVTGKQGDDFLYGDRIGDGWPLATFLAKWQRRFEQEQDDCRAAPCTRSGYAWEGLEDNDIPWMALKSAWRHTAGMVCLNCDQPCLLTNFGYPWTGFLSRSSRFIHVCGACRRSFRDESFRDVGKWMVENLDAEVLPDFDLFWHHRRAKWKGKA